MVSDKQRRESAPPTVPSNLLSDKTKYFLAEVIFLSFELQHMLMFDYVSKV